MAEVRLTPKARGYYQDLLAGEAGCGLRLSLASKGCSGLKYVLEVVEAWESDDALFPQEEGWVLGVASSDLAKLDGLILDVEEQSLGQKYVKFFHPRAQNTCGCGESFNWGGEA